MNGFWKIEIINDISIGIPLYFVNLNDWQLKRQVKPSRSQAAVQNLGPAARHYAS